jgi:hypothetical protein
MSGSWVSADPGRVDSNVNAAEPLHCLLNGIVHRRLICDVYLVEFYIDPGIFILQFLASALEERQV